MSFQHFQFFFGYLLIESINHIAKIINYTITIISFFSINHITQDKVIINVFILFLNLNKKVIFWIHSEIRYYYIQY